MHATPVTVGQAYMAYMGTRAAVGFAQDRDALAGASGAGSTSGNGWSISGGKITQSGSGGDFYAVIPVVNGRQYVMQLTFDTTGTSSKLLLTAEGGSAASGVRDLVLVRYYCIGLLNLLTVNLAKVLV